MTKVVVLQALWCMIVGHVSPPWRPLRGETGINRLLPPVGMSGYSLIHYRCQRCGKLVGP